MERFRLSEFHIPESLYRNSNGEFFFSRYDGDINDQSQFVVFFNLQDQILISDMGCFLPYFPKYTKNLKKKKIKNHRIIFFIYTEAFKSFFGIVSLHIHSFKFFSNYRKNYRLFFSIFFENCSTNFLLFMYLQLKVYQRNENYDGQSYDRTRETFYLWYVRQI